MRYSFVGKTSGFTLIEVVIGIVVLAISMSVILSVIVPTEQQSADQIQQVKAAELAQSLLEEILARDFDEHSDHAGNHWRCNETGRPSCTVQAKFSPDSGETNRSLYNDVDDYNGYTSLNNATGNSLDSSYGSFSLSVTVVYDGAALGLANNLAKRITVTVTTPLNTDIVFTGYKANF